MTADRGTTLARRQQCETSCCPYVPSLQFKNAPAEKLLLRAGPSVLRFVKGAGLAESGEEWSPNLA